MEDKIYNQLQQLNIFIDFVASLPETEGAENAEKAKWYLNNINDVSMHPSEWMVNIDIFDFTINQKTNPGLYWRKWGVAFETNYIEIEITEYHVTQSETDGEKVLFYLCVGCVEGLPLGNFESGVNEIEKFISNALKFRSHINGNFDTVEAEIYTDPEQKK